MGIGIPIYFFPEGPIDDGPPEYEEPLLPYEYESDMYEKSLNEGTEPQSMEDSGNKQ